MVFAAAFRVLGNAEDAEDALQEVFLKLLKPRRWLRLSETVRDWGAYLRAMAARTALDMLRRRRTYQPLEDLSGPVPGNPGQSPRLYVARKEQDFPYEEISGLLGMPATHVGVILHRVRRSLQEKLRPFIENGDSHSESDEVFSAMEGGE